MIEFQNFILSLSAILVMIVAIFMALATLMLMIDEKMLLPRIGTYDMGWDATSLRRDLARMADGVERTL